MEDITPECSPAKLRDSKLVVIKDSLTEQSASEGQVQSKNLSVFTPMLELHSFSERGEDKISDIELVKKAREHDYQAFEELVNRYEDKLYSLTYKITGNQDDAKDALQDTFISVFKALDNFEGKSSFSTWIYKIATNAALMKLRKRKKEPAGGGTYKLVMQDDIDWSKVAHPDGSISDTIAKDELKKIIDKAIKSLPSIYKAVFILRDIEKLSNEEAARVLGVSIAAVKARVHRARFYMRQQLATYLSGK